MGIVNVDGGKATGCPGAFVPEEKVSWEGKGAV
jgi:hypothetical protein